MPRRNARVRWSVGFVPALLAALALAITPSGAAAAASPARHAQHHSVHPVGAHLPHISSHQLQKIDRPAPPSLVGPGEGGRHARDPIDMKVLVISADGNETDFPAIKAFLSQLGVPFDTLIATTTPLTSSLLWDGANHGYYEGVILATGNLGYFNSTTNQWQSAFSDAQWQTLWQYEANFKVRQVTSYTAPFGYPDSYGLNPPTSQDTTTAPLQASLTSSGQGIYSYLNTATPVTFRNAWVYLATIKDPATTTPLLQTSTGYAIASLHSYPDGRQNLAVTAANNPYLVHSMLLSYGTINWVTKGLFLGARHVQLDTTVDDIFIDDNVWDPAVLNDNCSGDPNCPPYRMTGADLTVLLNWQSGVQSSSSNTAGVRVEWAFNGVGTAPGEYVPDTLTPTMALVQSQFNFVNHTYTHANLDTLNYGQTMTELTRNDNVASQMGFTNYWRDTFVQPDISGMSNPNFQQAAYDFGIRNMISDTSQSGWNNPTPNAGFYSCSRLSTPNFCASSPGILIIPRHPTNLFYNLVTPAQWVSEYNCYYGPQGTCANGTWRYWNHNLSYSEILNAESDFMLSYLLKWDIDPIMFHQTNTGAYDGVHSLYSDLIDTLLAKYKSLYNLPIIDHPQHQLATDVAQRMAYNASGVTASLVPCQSLTVTAKNAAVIPVTGVSNGPAGTTFETYGGQSIAYLNLAAGQSATVTVTC